MISTDDGLVPYLIVGPDRAVVEPVRRFLTDFVAQDNSPSSVRSYAFDLLRWWRWLRAVEVEWQRATPAEARDYVLWLRLSPKPGGQGASRPAGSINRITGKQLLDQRYRPRTVRHSNAVLRTFYAFWIERGEGPLINPIQRRRPVRDEQEGMAGGQRAPAARWSASATNALYTLRVVVPPPP